MDILASADERESSFHQWCFHETAEYQQKRQTLTEERREFEEEKKQFERKKIEFNRKMEMEDRRMEQEKKLFDMKFKILQEELVKLADEKKQVEREKAFFERVNEFEAANEKNSHSGYDIDGRVFFTGVGNRQSLKKRYKDLIKIYHPDNLDGDTNILQLINQQFDELNKVMSSADAR